MTSQGSALRELAAFHGINESYADAQGTLRRASPEVLISLLRALGVPLEEPDEAGPLLRLQQVEAFERGLEPVLVHRTEGPCTVSATMPADFDLGTAWLSIELEQGDMRRMRLQEAATGCPDGSEADGRSYQHLRLNLSGPSGGELPPGRHKVVIEGAGTVRSALLLSAPKCPLAGPKSGVFMPLHAIRTVTDWGIGSYSDLERLSAWATSEGCDFVGTLPLYPAFLSPPADPSPYLPVSRLAYNEVFIDPVALPEFAASDEVRELCSSTRFQEQLSSLRSTQFVAYEEVAQLKRSVLERLAWVAASGSLPGRQGELAAFASEHPELEGYASFRARLDSPTDEESPSLVAYHLYCQWAAHEQLTAAGRRGGCYADFPIGSHPGGFDPTRYPDSFVPGVHGGAPPDRFFALGQDWGFHPLHPQRIREDGYAFLTAALRRAFRHADFLRIDHVMGLQRLFMIPENGGEGAYVSYRAEELHALVALEASRAGAIVVGEDLGTVPEELRPRMARDHILRTWVFQFESTTDEPLPAPPAHSLASLGTHDLPRFGAYLWGDDIAQREALGLLSPEDTVTEWRKREEWRRSLFDALGLSDIDADVEKVTAAALEGCLLGLARSDATILLVDLQELWDERGQDNVPGLGSGGSNWRRRSSRTVDEIETDARADALLHEITTGRKG